MKNEALERPNIRDYFVDAALSDMHSIYLNNQGTWRYAQALDAYCDELENLHLADADYWKRRCLLAEKCLEESPGDPDITAEQIKAWNAYHRFISWAGNDRSLITGN